MNKKDIQNAIDFLLKNKCGTSRFLQVEKNGWRIAIVFGWQDEGENLGDEYADDNWHIACKVGIQEVNNIMQCDLDIDWQYPICKATGDCWDTSCTIYPDTNLDDLIKDLKKQYNEILKLDIDCQGEY